MIYTVKRSLYILLLFFFCCQNSYAKNKEEGTVLVINSYTEAYLWTVAAYDGLVNYF